VAATVLYIPCPSRDSSPGRKGPGKGLGDGGHRLYKWSPIPADADRNAIACRWPASTAK